MKKGLAINNFFSNKILIGTLLFFLVEPESMFKIAPELHKVYIVVNYIILAFVIVIAIFSTLNSKWTSSMSWICLYFGVIIIATLWNNPGNFFRFVLDYYRIIALCILTEFCIRNNPDAFFDATLILDLYVYINLISMLLFTRGIYVVEGEPYWLLGHKNFIIRTILPILVLALFRTYRRYGSMTLYSFFLFGAVGLTTLLSRSATSIVGFVLFTLFLIIFHSKTKPLPFWLNVPVVIIVAIVLFLIIVVFNLQEYFEFLIVDVLGKSMTFTGRLTIWQDSIMLFAQKPFFGRGYLTSLNYSEIFGAAFFSHPHNYFLYNLLMGGAALGGTLCYGFFIMHRSIGKANTVYAKISLFMLISFLMMGITESLTSTVMLYPSFVLIMNSWRLKEYGDKSRKRIRIKLK